MDQRTRTHFQYNPKLSYDPQSYNVGKTNYPKCRQIYLKSFYPNEMTHPKYYRCENPICTQKLPWEQMQIHHIFPVRIAPQLRYDAKNMLLLCPTCHRLIHDCQYQADD